MQNVERNRETALPIEKFKFPKISLEIHFSECQNYLMQYHITNYYDHCINDAS